MTRTAVFWLVLLPIFAAFLQLQQTAAAEVLLPKGMTEEELEEFMHEAHFGYDEGDDYDSEDEEEEMEDDLWSEEDLRLIQESMDAFSRNTSLNRAAGLATVDGTTTVTNGNTYWFYSHDTYGVINSKYPNNYIRYWNFILDPDVYCIEFYCRYFKIERAKYCRKDRLIFYLPPYKNGKRFCGKTHGLTRKYFETDVRVVFKTNKSVRKPGFCCEARPSPHTCCTRIPEMPAVRTLVTSCADVVTDGTPCTCTDIGPSAICLVCSFCQNCDLQILADHDFSGVTLYTHFMFPCDNCTINLAANSYGHEQTVGGYVGCFDPNPYAHAILPTYSANAIQLIVRCPLSSAFDECDYFSLFVGRRRALDVSQKRIGNLAESCGGGATLLIMLPCFDCSLVPHSERECVTIVDIMVTNPACSPGGILDLTPLTSLQTIKLNCASNFEYSLIKTNSHDIETASLSSSACNPSCVFGSVSVKCS